MSASKIGGGLKSLFSGKSRLWLFLVAILAAALLVVYFLSGGPAREISPEQAETALSNTLAAESYRFTTTSTIFLDQAERLFCQLAGEKMGENRHIEGELLGTPINIYLVDHALYQQSNLDKSWRQVADADLEAAQKLVAEIAPETNFQYLETGEIIYLGEEQLDGQTVHKVALTPVLADAWIEQYFTDIRCELWLDSDGEYVIRALTTAISAENPDVHLTIENAFSSFGEAMEIMPPL